MHTKKLIQISRSSSLTLIIFLITACSTISDIRPNKDENSYSFYSYPSSYDKWIHIRKSIEFCQSKDKQETAEVISTRNVRNTYGDEVIQTTFFCATKEKIQQLAAEKETIRLKAQQESEERRRIETTRRTQETEKQAKLEADKVKRIKEEEALLFPKAMELLNQRNRQVANYCKVPTAINKNIREYVSKLYGVHPNSITLESANFKPLDASPNPNYVGNRSPDIYALILELKGEFNGLMASSQLAAHPICKITLYHPKGLASCQIYNDRLTCK